MNKLEILVRRFKRRFMGIRYCTIASRSGHEFEHAGRIRGVSGFYVKCRKCGKTAFYCPMVGGIID